MTQHSQDRSPVSRDQQAVLNKWDREARNTSTVPCSEPGCLHQAQRQWPGLDSTPSKCPLHQ